VSVFLVVDWIDGIPETVRVYACRDAAEQAARVLGRGHSVQEWSVLGGE